MSNLNIFGNYKLNMSSGIISFKMSIQLTLGVFIFYYDAVTFGDLKKKNQSLLNSVLKTGLCPILTAERHVQFSLSKILCYIEIPGQPLKRWNIKATQFSETSLPLAF